MIIPLEETEYRVASRIFRTAFDATEHIKFQRAWRNRTQPYSLGYWKDNRLIGVAIVCGKRLHYIYIEPKYRSNGFGSELLQAVLALSPTLHLTPVDNPDIHNWYAQHGFRLSQVNGPYRLYVHHEHNLRSLSTI